MKKVLPIVLLFLFCLQLSIKTLIVGYFSFVSTNIAKENCQYKSITVCKGNCYVVKQIRIFTSDASPQKNKLPGIDIKTIKDVGLADQSFTTQLQNPDHSTLIEYSDKKILYVFNHAEVLIKPPIA